MPQDDEVEEWYFQMPKNNEVIKWK
jgi:hypothetical protein